MHQDRNSFSTLSLADVGATLAVTSIDLMIHSYSTHIVSLEMDYGEIFNHLSKKTITDRTFGWWMNIVNRRLIGANYHKRPDECVLGWLVPEIGVETIRFHVVLGFERRFEVSKAAKIMLAKWEVVAPGGGRSRRLQSLVWPILCKAALL
jgi:hypothetical protein